MSRFAHAPEPFRAIVCLALTWFAPAMAAAEQTATEPAPTTVVVAVDAAGTTPAWLAEAMQEALASEIDGTARLAVRAAGDAVQCRTDSDCLIARARRSGAALVVRGSVTQGTLKWELYETVTPARLDSGAIPIDPAAGLIGIKQHTRRALAAVLKPGGFLDQMPYRSQWTAGRAAPDLVAQAGRGRRAVLVLAIAAGAMAAPLLLAAGCVVRRRTRLARLRGLWGACLLALGGGAVAAAGGRKALAAALTRMDGMEPGGLALLGGLAWGWLLLRGLRFVFPVFGRLEHVDHQQLPRMVATWLAAAAQRALVLALTIAPVVVVAALVCRALDTPVRVSVALIGPAVAGLIWLGIAASAEVLVLYLDDRHVVGAASSDNPWHRSIRKYLLCYVRRVGWNLDSRLLERVLFLPGTRAGISSYGPAAGQQRIVIDIALLRLALGPNACAAAEDEDVQWPNWSLGTVLPGSPAPARWWRRRARSRRKALDDLGRAALRRRTESDYQPHATGQAAAMLGYVVPAERDELVPLIADDVGDLDVVRELLAEHYPWQAPDPDEQDDDTDPTQKDFLFGPLAHAFGTIERGDERWATFGLVVDELCRRARPRFRRLSMAVVDGMRALLWSRTHVLGDAYAALHFAYHHLVQYVYYRHSWTAEVLTARAAADELAAATATVFARVGEGSSAPAAGPASRSARRRLARLAALGGRPVHVRRKRRLRLGLAGAAGAVVLVALSIAIKRSVDYHPVYTQRMAEQQQRPAHPAGDRLDFQQRSPIDGRQDPSSE
jgi:hypothetical protein